MNLYIKKFQIFYPEHILYPKFQKKMTDLTDWLTMTDTQTDSIYRLELDCFTSGHNSLGIRK